MKTFVQIILFLITFTGTYFIVYYIPFALLSDIRGIRMPRIVLSLLAAFVAASFVFKKLEDIPEGLAKSIALGGVITGSACFYLGLFVPMIVNSDSNLGPMLGFFTGPIGFFAGLPGGAIYWKLYQKK